MAKNRISIPIETAAKVLFLSDRTCCVCREEGKKVQIHHIDENSANNEIDNLSVLCFECHTETMIRGGFHRKLDADQIILYRNDWLNIIARKRIVSEIKDSNDKTDNSSQVELATSIAEIYKENQEYELLAIHYNRINNIELRDKYIKIALLENPSDSSIIYLKNLQGKSNDVSLEITSRYIEKLQKLEDWYQIARTYRDNKNSIESLKYYLKGLTESLENKRIFTTAFYLKELSKSGIFESLFEKSFIETKEKNDLWWQIRSLQELGWNTELENLVKENREEILKSKNISLLRQLAKIEGNTKEYIEIQKKIAKMMHIYDNGSIGFRTEKKG